MKIATWLIFLLTASTPSARGRCSDPNLASAVPAFEVSQISRVNALLRFAEAHNVCLGIEYVDAELLTAPVTVHVQAGTMEDSIRTILGHQRAYSIRVTEKVIQISARLSDPDTKNIFDYILPDFESRRGSLQEVSNMLGMQLILDLIAPRVTGFAGSFPPGDTSNEVGPFDEHNRTLRFLLSAVLSQTKGGAWISKIAWNLKGDFTIPQKRRVWTYVEYGSPNPEYDGTLQKIAADLEADSTH